MRTKWLKALMVSFPIVIGGPVAQAQEQPQVGYGDVAFSLTNSSTIFVVSGLPQPLNSSSISNVHVGDVAYELYTDGSGKITGFAMMDMIVTNWVAGQRIVTFTTNVLNVTGSLSTVGTNASVRMTLSGSGIAVQGASYGRSKLSYKFVGSRNSANQLAGTLSGSFKPGIKGLASTSFKDVPALIASVSSGWRLSDCNFEFAYVENDLFVEGCMFAPVHGYYVGRGKSSDQGAFAIQVRGYDEATGSKFTLSGLSPMSAAGKAYGQRVTATGNGLLTRYP
jgi:hypothetical protein